MCRLRLGLPAVEGVAVVVSNGSGFGDRVVSRSGAADRGPPEGAFVVGAGFAAAYPRSKGGGGGPDR